MSQINGYPSPNPYSYGTGDTVNNPALDTEALRAKQIQADGLRMSNDATQDSNVKSAAEKRR
ncbi:hypothetical protein [Pseudomonas sp. W4I3]|uniref:hypothetical protein n=1 Tax=Pseudomonas sp. W4I3 TaxID=3042294 RepID=UPI002789496F|nr:hypothetical protein [Pseudomonas sp. W4I3]MDQ0738441.1 hypothetical protein [Pseudomonas sp. W4I3]